MKKYKKFLFNEKEWQQVISNLNNREEDLVDREPVLETNIPPLDPVIEEVIPPAPTFTESEVPEEDEIHQDVTRFNDDEVYEAKSFDEVRASLAQELEALNNLKEEAARSADPDNIADINDYRLDGSYLDGDVLSFDEIEPESYGMRRAG